MNVEQFTRLHRALMPGWPAHDDDCQCDIYEVATMVDEFINAARGVSLEDTHEGLVRAKDLLGIAPEQAGRSDADGRSQTERDWAAIVEGWLKEAERQMEAAHDRDDILGYEAASHWRQEFRGALALLSVTSR